MPPHGTLGPGVDETGALSSALPSVSPASPASARSVLSVSPASSGFPAELGGPGSSPGRAPRSRPRRHATNAAASNANAIRTMSDGPTKRPGPLSLPVDVVAVSADTGLPAPAPAVVVAGPASPAPGAGASPESSLTG